MEQETKTTTISSAIKDFLDVVRLARSQNTALTYGKALKEFQRVLAKQKIDPATSPAGMLTEDLISKFAMHLKSFAPATEQLYVRAVARFYRHLSAERLAEINLPRMDILNLAFACRNFLQMTLSASWILCRTLLPLKRTQKSNGYAQCEIEPF
jgi:hypothetical protein